MVLDNMEIVHEGMLKKSPPPKPLFRAKWRLRWFVLRSGELPGQYFLEYYTDHTRRKLKGRIDLDQCDQVDAGITFPTRKSESDFKYMFDIKTPKRVYYLCAETEQEMNRWVDCVCHVCGLKIYSQEDDVYPPIPPDHLSPTPPLDQPLESPPLSPSSPGSSISGPYIPISTCFTGKRTPNSNASSFPFGDDVPLMRALENHHHRSSIPSEMAPSAPIVAEIQPPLTQASSIQPPLTHAPPAPVNTGAIPREAFGVRNSEDALSVQSPLGTECSSVFSEDEWTATTPHKPDGKFFSDVVRPICGLKIRDVYNKEGSGRLSPSGNPSTGLTLADEDHQMLAAPPRPPKPAHLAEPVPQLTYQNLESLTSVVRRNSSTDKVKNGYGGGAVVVQETPPTIIPSDDPEPSPVSTVSVASTFPPSTPRDVGEETHMSLRPTNQPFSESISPQASERSKSRHCYNNFTSQIFSYDVRHHDKPSGGELDPRISPAGGLYSNIPPPQSGKSPVYPPAVDRGLKPKKNSECSNPSPSELSPPAAQLEAFGAIGGANPGATVPAAPIVHRNLKPAKVIQAEPTTKMLFVLDPAPVRNKKHNNNNNSRKTRAAPSPTPPSSTHNGRTNESGDEPDPSTPTSRRDSTNTDEQVFFPLHTASRAQLEIQYLDLDLDQESNKQSPKSGPISMGVKGVSLVGGTGGGVGVAGVGGGVGGGGAGVGGVGGVGVVGGGGLVVTGASAPSVVYKKVDFVKTDAFNKMRVTVEDTYRKNQ